MPRKIQPDSGKSLTLSEYVSIFAKRVSSILQQIKAGKSVQDSDVDLYSQERNTAPYPNKDFAELIAHGLRTAFEQEFEKHNYFCKFKIDHQGQKWTVIFTYYYKL